MNPSDEVMRLLDFDADDLKANRAGHLSERQRQRLGRLRRRAALLSGGIIFAIVLLASAVIFFGQREDSAIAVLIGIGLTAVNAVLMARAVQSWLRLDEDLRRGEIETLSGTIERTVRVVGRALIYLIKIDGRELNVPKAVFNVLPDGGRWHIYRARRSASLLAAEPDEISR